MATDYQRLVFALAALENRVANMVRQGTVKEVAGDKMIVTYDKQQGEDVDSPYLHHTDRRGGARIRNFYKKGQNVTLICPNGDVRQAIVTSWSKNKQYPQPDHANDSGQDEETYQLDESSDDQQQQGGQGGQGGSGGKLAAAGGGGGGGNGSSLCGSNGADGCDWWVQEKEQKQAQEGQSDSTGGQQGGQQQSKERKVGGEKAIVKTRMNKEKGLTGRFGKDVRYMIDKDAAKLKAGEKNWIQPNKKEKRILAHTEKSPWINMPWEIVEKEDPQKDDDA